MSNDYVLRRPRYSEDPGYFSKIEPELRLACHSRLDLESRFLLMDPRIRKDDNPNISIKVYLYNTRKCPDTQRGVDLLNVLCWNRHGYGFPVNDKQRKGSMIATILMNIVLWGSLISIVGILVWEFIKKLKGPLETEVNIISDEDMEILRRMNNLFQETPIHGGGEWKTLSVLELVSVCKSAIDVACKIHESSRESLLLDASNRCNSLSVWMKENSKRPFYEDSNMTYLVEKPAEVARLLREEAFKL